MLGKLIKINGIILLVPIISFFFLPGAKASGLLIGILVSSASILVNAWVIDTFWDRNYTQFNEIFFFSLLLRFIIVVIIVISILGMTKIDEIYFTVSFIISYLYNSITEMIFFNEILDKKSSQK